MHALLRIIILNSDLWSHQSFDELELKALIISETDFDSRRYGP